MNTKQQVSLQKQIIDYFEKYDDKLVKDVSLSFIYDKGTNNEEVSKLCEKFLEDNGLTKAFINYQIDQKKVRNNEQFSFFASSGSEREMIEQVKISMLNMCFNRFSRLIDSIKPQKEEKLIEPEKIKITYNDGDEDIHITHNYDGYTLCGNVTDGSEIKSSVIVKKGKVTCEHCLDIVKRCKKMKI